MTEMCLLEHSIGARGPAQPNKFGRATRPHAGVLLMPPGRRRYREAKLPEQGVPKCNFGTSADKIVSENYRVEILSIS